MGGLTDLFGPVPILKESRHYGILGNLVLAWWRMALRLSAPPDLAWE